MALKFSRNGVENAFHLLFKTISMFFNVLTIEVEDHALFPVDLEEIAMLDKVLHHLRHSANQQVFAEIIHCLGMDGAKWPFLFKAVFDERHHHLVAQSPKKFLEIHRIHLDAPLFRGNQYVLDILVDGNQRASLDVIITPVGHQMLDGRPRLRILLNLIEHNQGVALMQGHMKVQLELKKQLVAVMQIVVEDVAQWLRHVAEIHKNGRFILFGKLTGDITLSNTPCTVKQNGHTALVFRLPFQ